MASGGVVISPIPNVNALLPGYYKKEAMEIMVARSAMALAKRKQSKGGDNQSLDSS